MSKNLQVIIIQKCENLPDGMRQSLIAKGFRTTIVETEKEAEEAVEDKAEIVTLIYCAPDSNVKSIAESLTEYEELHKHPLIIIGGEVDRLESFLNKYFILATTLTTPCTSNDILSAVSYVIKYVDRIRKQRSGQPKKSGADETKAIYKEFKTVPISVFQQLDQLGLFAKDIGGAKYATTFKPQTLTDKYFYPKNTEVLEVIRSLSKDISDAQNSRYHRIGLLSHHLLTALGFTDLFLEDAKVASFLYSPAFFYQGTAAASGEYLSSDKLLLRKEICSLAKDSVISFKDSLGERSSEIIKTIGKLIGDEVQHDDSVVSLAASTIATADAVDRVVFYRGVFQPVAAYCVLSKLKRETYSFIHPTVLGLLIKLLAEAVTSEAAGIAKTKRLKGMATFLDAASDIDDAIIRQDEKLVPVGNLTPGMIISRPLHTYDGKQLLDESVQLDQDLIWRLWQLAAVRPLQKRVVVTNE